MDRAIARGLRGRDRGASTEPSTPDVEHDFDRLSAARRVDELLEAIARAARGSGIDGANAPAAEAASPVRPGHWADVVRRSNGD